ncbi:MAG TPA: hypothetical protein VGB23_01500 [Nitrospirota bacterium]
MKGLRVVLLAFIAGTAICFASVTDAAAYEFHMLNGNIIQGDLTSFKEGVFTLETFYGIIEIETDKLDYVIIQKSDPGPAAFKAAAPVPGIKLQPGQQEKAGMPEAVMQDGESAAPVPPTPLSSMSVGPAPARSWSIKGAAGYPGGFRGADK